MRPGSWREGLRQGALPVNAPLSGEYQVGLATRSGARLKVTRAVTDDWNAREVDAKTLTDLVEQTGGRLTTSTLVFGSMGAEKNRINPSTQGCQLLVHFGVHGIERSDVEQATSEPRLVRGDCDMPARMV